MRFSFLSGNAGTTVEHTAAGRISSVLLEDRPDPFGRTATLWIDDGAFYLRMDVPSLRKIIALPSVETELVYVAIRAGRYMMESQGRVILHSPDRLIMSVQQGSARRGLETAIVEFEAEDFGALARNLILEK